MPNVKRNNHLPRIRRVGWIGAALWLVAFGWAPQLLAANSDVNVKVCYPTPYPAPTVTSPADGTTTQDASILMTGDATPNIPVYVYRNNVQVGFVTAGGDGVFAISISLSTGSNELKASTNNDCHAPSFSNTVTVERTTAPTPEPEPEPETSDPPAEEQELADEQQPPPVTGNQPRQPTPPGEQPLAEGQRPVILEPRDGSLIRDPFVLVVGRAAPNTPVRILRNDQVMAEVLTDAEGMFRVRISLEPGSNRLVVATGEGATELFSEEVVVTYDPKAASPNWSEVFIWAVVALIVGFISYYLVWRLAQRVRHRLGGRRKSQK